MAKNNVTPAVDQAIQLLERQTARDKQWRVGPSELGMMCQKCLAEKLISVAPAESSVALAPTIGTAVHAYLENRSKNFEDPTKILVETKVIVGEVKGYGTVKGTMDRFDIPNKTGIDYKVVAKKKAKDYKKCFVETSSGEVYFDDDNYMSNTLKQYYAQLNLYGKGMEDAGHEVERVSLMLINRDATTETIRQGVTEIPFKYNRAVAENVLKRAGEIYTWVTAPGNSVDDLDSDPNCYYCKYKRPAADVDIF